MITTIEEFADAILKLKKAYSAQAKVYTINRIASNRIYFTRGNKIKEENIKLEQLFDFYSHGIEINTNVAKSFGLRWKQSPAVAIIRQLQREKSVTQKNDYQASEDKNDTIKASSTTNHSNAILKDHKAETRFFHALEQVVGTDNLLSKSIGKSITSEDIFLDSDFRTYDLSDDVKAIYQQILSELHSDYNFSSIQLASFIDGIMINLPGGRKRIVEFDEEQHFTPARAVTIKHLINKLDNPYLTIFQSICANGNYFKKVLKKNRIKQALSLPDSYNDFLVELRNEKLSGYIEPKNGFNYIGGRIAQRAYYDTLRDTAHLSPMNPNLDPPIRFAKKTFEDLTKTSFESIEISDLSLIIKDMLNDLFQLKY